VIQIDGDYYFNAANVFMVKGDGSEGDLIGSGVKKDYILADYGFAGLEAVVKQYVADIAFVEVMEGEIPVLIVPSYVDIKVAEAIREEPEYFPNIGEAVLERSKRVITRLEFG